jgi:hypothetical protein
MKTIRIFAAKAVIALTAFAGAFSATFLAAPADAKADPHYHFSPHVHVYRPYIPHYSLPHYHAPSVHYHRTYHPDYYHWTPSRGLHSHGHYDYTPHYTPGHWHW